MSEATKFDPHRRLCPDGACIGVIGSDGRCRVCGRSSSGKDAGPVGFVPAAAEDQIEDRDQDEDEDGKNAGGAAAAAAAAAEGKAVGAAFDPNRRLCPDGSCLGVIGADGVCNVCGQKAD
jgi:hypothetical protein